MLSGVYLSLSALGGYHHPQAWRWHDGAHLIGSTWRSMAPGGGSWCFIEPCSFDIIPKKMDPRVKQTSRFFRPQNLKRSIPPGQLECSMIHTVILRCIPIPPINQTPSTSLQDTELCAACIAPFRPSTKEASSNKLEDLDRWGDEKFPVQSVWFQVALVDFLVE